MATTTLERFLALAFGVGVLKAELDDRVEGVKNRVEGCVMHGLCMMMVAQRIADIVYSCTAAFTRRARFCFFTDF
jgi:hypothetical protein